MVQVAVTLQDEFDFDATSGTSASFTIAVGEGLLIMATVEVTDSGKEISDVDWDLPTPEPLAEPIASHVPGHGKLRQHIWWLETPTPGTDTVTVTISSGNSQKTGVDVFTVAPREGDPEGRQVEEGTDATGAVTPVQTADGLAFMLGSHFKLNGINLAGTETKHTDKTIQGAYRMASFTEDGSGSTLMEWVDASVESGENATMGFNIDEPLPTSLLKVLKPLLTQIGR